MKITFLTPTLKVTGGNIVLKRYAEYLSKNGHSVTIIGVYESYGIFDDISNLIKIKNIQPKINSFIHVVFFNLFLLRAYERKLEYSDVLIPIFSPLLVHAIFCKKRNKAAKVFFLYQDAKNIRYFGIYNRLLFKMPWVYNNVDLIMAISNLLKNYYLGGKDLPGIVLPNGIESDIFYRREKIEKKNYILFVGTKRKGLQKYLAVARAYMKIDKNQMFYVVCPHPVINRISDNVKIINVGKDRHRLAEIYNASKLYVGLSKIESFGLTALEAMASGTCILLAKNDGVVDYCKDKNNCIFINKLSIKGISSQIEELINNDNLMKELEQNGQKTVKKYRWDHSYELLDYVIRGSIDR